MMANLFHTGLFGYSKTSVNDYISKLNEEFSGKLLAKEEENKKEQQALRAEIARLTAENEQLQAARQEVADALISAKDYATELKRHAEAENQSLKDKNAACRQAEFRRIQHLAEHVQSLHCELRSALEQMDRELTAYHTECSRLQADLVGQNQDLNTQKEGEACSSTK